MSKWRFEGEQELRPNPTKISSDAARFNHMLLKKLEKAFEKDQETNLMDLIPSNYSSRLTEKRKKRSGAISGCLFSQKYADVKYVSLEENLNESNHPSPTGIHSQPLSNKCHHTIVHPLSSSVSNLLEIFGKPSKNADDGFALRLDMFLQAGKTLWVSETCANHRVVRYEDVVVKVVPNSGDFTEYTSMLYLEEHHSEIPAPRAKGLLTIEGTAYIFMSYIPGVTLDKIWKSLCEEQKISIRNQLDRILLRLRDLRHSEEMPLGGVREEGCKDTRRHTRYSKTPIFNDVEFDNFLFSNPHFGGSVYIKTLRQLAAKQSSRLCFCHGDLRPDNIVIQVEDDDKCRVTGLLDWEKSGFYPEYFECVKATSTMSTSETNDWFLFLPKSASPSTYPERWLVDRLWDKHVA